MNDLTFHFTAADVAANFDAGTLHRGRDYARRGKVLAVTADGDAIKGKVSGSGGQRYRQTVRLKPGPRGVRDRRARVPRGAPVRRGPSRAWRGKEARAFPKRRRPQSIAER